MAVPIGKGDIPLGLGMALAQDIQAMNRFAALSPQQQQQVIDHTHQIQSREQMREYVHRLAEGSLPG
ncbi:MAG: hypothetical protein ACOX6U_09375 [Oscillospiraceae bacterium]